MTPQRALDIRLVIRLNISPRRMRNRSHSCGTPQRAQREREREREFVRPEKEFVRPETVKSFTFIQDDAASPGESGKVIPVLGFIV